MSNFIKLLNQVGNDADVDADANTDVKDKVTGIALPIHSKAKNQVMF